MKSYLFMLFHIIGLFFAYCAFGIVFYWIFHVHIFIPNSLKASYYLPLGIVTLLPMVGFICIRYGLANTIYKQL